MSSTHHAHPTGESTPPPGLLLTWYVTRSYQHLVPLTVVAEATGRTVDELAADPASLTGAPDERLLALLIEWQTPERAIDNPDVEIGDARYDAAPALAGLVDAARAAVDAESRTGQHTPAGRALAALLAGLRREEVTDR